MFTAEFLSDMRKRALRKGVWYRTLDRVERGIVSLIVRIVDRVERKLLGARGAGEAWEGSSGGGGLYQCRLLNIGVI